jgi:hypothetical protein
MKSFITPALYNVRTFQVAILISLIPFHCLGRPHSVGLLRGHRLSFLTGFCQWQVVGLSTNPQPVGPLRRIYNPRGRVTHLYLQAPGTHFGRLLRSAWAVVGLFFSPVTTRGINKYIMRPTKCWFKTRGKGQSGSISEVVINVLVLEKTVVIMWINTLPLGDYFAYAIYVNFDWFQIKHRSFSWAELAYGFCNGDEEYKMLTNKNFGVSKCCKNVLIFSLTSYYLLIRNISIINNFIWDNMKKHKANSKSPVHRKS